MFILRRIDSTGVEVNTMLDVYYTLILKDDHRDVFDEATKLWEKETIDRVYGIVCVEDEDLIMPLYLGSFYYIMTDEGKTFANISKKK